MPCAHRRRRAPEHGRDKLTGEAPHERLANIFLRIDDFHDAIIASRSSFIRNLATTFCSVAGMVRVAGEDGEGTVDLLGEDDASELMGQGNVTEREDEAGAGASGGWPAVVGADGTDNRE